jgi:hypothetical protein
LLIVVISIKGSFDEILCLSLGTLVSQGPETHRTDDQIQFFLDAATMQPGGLTPSVLSLMIPQLGRVNCSEQTESKVDPLSEE